MIDYRPYVKLFQLSKQYIPKIASLEGLDIERQKKELLGINQDFNNFFWHNFKHLYMDLDSEVKEDVKNIFYYLDVSKPINIQRLVETLSKTQQDSRNELPLFLSTEILEEVNTR